MPSQSTSLTQTSCAPSPLCCLLHRSGIYRQVNLYGSRPAFVASIAGPWWGTSHTVGSNTVASPLPQYFEHSSRSALLSTPRAPYGAGLLCPGFHSSPTSLGTGRPDISTIQNLSNTRICETDTRGIPGTLVFQLSRDMLVVRQLNWAKVSTPPSIQHYSSTLAPSAKRTFF